MSEGTLPDRTREFADMVVRAKGKEYQAMHPSKLTFQSLRVHINQEFEEIRRGISAAFQVLKENGRCGLLTWKHSECAIVMDCYRNFEITQVQCQARPPPAAAAAATVLSRAVRDCKFSFPGLRPRFPVL